MGRRAARRFLLGQAHPRASRSVPRARVLFAIARAILATGLLAAPCWSGTTGKLTGRVTDEERKPLAAVEVRVDGLRVGTVSGPSGEYVLIGIPAGSYTIRANLIGQSPFVAEHVDIQPD